MKCVICKTGDVKKASVQSEIKVGYDHLLVIVEAEACTECGEPYYTSDTMRYLGQLREKFRRREIAPPLVGKVYEIS